MNLPLLLTLSRIFLGPLFLMFYLYSLSWGIPLLYLPYVLLMLAILSELSDVLDGMLARRRNKVTELGKLLDPMADSIFRLSVLLSFTQGVIAVPVLLVILFFYRDTVISTLRTVCALRGVTLGARWSGKVKAVVQAAVVFFILILMIPYTMGLLDEALLKALSFYAVLLAAVYTLYSGCEYIVANRIHIRKALGF